MDHHIKDIEKFVTIDFSFGKKRRRNLKGKIIFRVIQCSFFSILFWTVVNFLLHTEITGLISRGGLEIAAIFIIVLPLIYVTTFSIYQLYLLKKYCLYMAKRLY